MAVKTSAQTGRIWLDYTNLMDDIGGPSQGVTRAELESELPRTGEMTQWLKKERANGKLAFMDLPYQKQYVRDIENYVRRIPEMIDNLVVIGIGGSALGNIMLHSALNHSGRERELYKRTILMCTLRTFSVRATRRVTRNNGRAKGKFRVIP
jgi:hypothetical protein